MTKKDIVAKLTEAGVDFDETMTAAQLHKEFPEILNESEEEDEEIDGDQGAVGSREASAAQDPSGAKSAVHFTIQDIGKPGNKSIRTFSFEQHGENFLELADEFEKSNTHVRPEDTKNAEQVKAANAFNLNIKNPVMGRRNE